MPEHRAPQLHETHVTGWSLAATAGNQEVKRRQSCNPMGTYDMKIVKSFGTILPCQPLPICPAWAVQGGAVLACTCMCWGCGEGGPTEVELDPEHVEGVEQAHAQRLRGQGLREEVLLAQLHEPPWLEHLRGEHPACLKLLSQRIRL